MEGGGQYPYWHLQLVPKNTAHHSMPAQGCIVPMQSNTVLYIELVTDFEHLNNLVNKKVWMVKTGHTISKLLQFLPPNIIV